MKIMPYRTIDDRIDGAGYDIHRYYEKNWKELKEANEALRRSKESL